MAPFPAALGALWRVAAAEAAGAALLVLLSCLPVCAAQPAPAPVAALAGAATVAALVTSLDHVSGAMFNPAVLLAVVLRRGLRWRRALPLLAAQLLGAAAGAGALRALAAGDAAACVTRPAEVIGPLPALLLEALAAALLVLANCANWDPRAAGRGDSWPLRLGATVAALSLALVSPPPTVAPRPAPPPPDAPFAFAGRGHGRQHEPGAQLRARAAVLALGPPLGQFGLRPARAPAGRFRGRTPIFPMFHCVDQTSTVACVLTFGNSLGGNDGLVTSRFPQVKS